jgi:hypothetical protein
MPLRRIYTVAIWLALGAAAAAHAQDEIVADETAPAETPSSEYNTVIDEAPFATSRAAGMAGAISPVADDLDAAVHNPAGIGGLRWGKQKVPFARKVYFPYVSGGANPDSDELTSELGTMAKERPSTGVDEAAEEDSETEVDHAIEKAAAGKRQYVRASILPTGLVLGRAMIVPFTDQQIAAVSHGPDTGLIDMRIRSLSGIGAGLSATDPQERFAIGYFGYTGTRRETAGTFTFDEFTDAEQRSAAISDKSTTYTGMSNNVGMNFRLGQKATPTLAVVLKNAGDTTWAADEGEDLVVEQDLTVGFGLSPQLGKSGFFNFVLEAYRLMDEEVSFQKKYRVGMELTLGGFGSHAIFGLRTGYSDEGAAGGLTLNLGLIGVEAAMHGVDIGAGNERVIEQRYLGTVFVNVAEF